MAEEQICPRHPLQKLTEEEDDKGSPILVCSVCGYYVEQAHFSKEPTFTKGAAGESAVAGQYVSDSHNGVRLANGRVYGGTEPHEKSLRVGRQQLENLVYHLNIIPHNDTVDGAHRLYKMAVTKEGFTRGRRRGEVAGACLYIFTRQTNKPVMLIDISDALAINVFDLGGVFLQLIRALCLDTHDNVIRPVDPSLFLERFVRQLECMSGASNQAVNAVQNTALRLVKSMKRDWMQTGRRPSGICGAAIFIACHIHGFQPTRRDVVVKVHIGESTLSRRISEFSSTQVASQTMSGFEADVMALEAEEQAAEQGQALLVSPEAQELGEGEGSLIQLGGCSHTANEEAEVYAVGLCKDCYAAFLNNSGGYKAGKNPPCFDKPARRRKRRRTDEESGGDEEEEQEVSALSAPGDEEADEVEADMQAMLNGPMQQIARDVIPEDQLQPAAPTPGRQPLPAAQTAAAPPEVPARSHRRRGRQQTPPGAEPASQQASAPDMQASQQASASQGCGRHQAQQAPTASPLLVMSANGHLCSQPETQSSAHGGGQLGTQASPRRAASNLGAATQAGEDDDEEHAEERAIVIAEEPAEDMIDTLSDVSDADLDRYLLDPETREFKVKKETWEALNKEWVEKEELKRQQQAEAEKAHAEREAAEAAGEPVKRRRGRPPGSKTKAKAEDSLEPGTTAAESVNKFLATQKMSHKINPDVLMELFGDEPDAGNEAGPDAAAQKAQAALLELQQQQRQKEQKKRELEQQRRQKEQKRLGGLRAGSRLSGSSDIDMLGQLNGTQTPVPGRGRLGGLGRGKKKANPGPASPNFQPQSPDRRPQAA